MGEGAGDSLIYVTGGGGMPGIKKRSLFIAALAAFVALTAGALLRTAAVAEPVVQARRVQPMSDERFWSLINQSAQHENDPQSQLKSLEEALVQLPPEEIEAFDAAFWRQMSRAYTWDLWGAAYVVHGGASDDGFEYFRRWLISKGQAVFETALAHPDNLADMLAADVEGVLEFEDFGYVARSAWARRSGRSEDDFPGEGETTIGRAPAGVAFKDDAGALAARYPKLWRRFGKSPLG